jgi:hypothetical protein
MVYNLIWAPRQSDVGPMETWLQSHGYVAEKAYLHKTGTTTTQADRVTTTIWGSARFLTNPADPGYLAWKRYETSQLTALRASGKRYDGLFIDELGTGMMGQHLPGKALEYAATTDYFDDFRTLIAAMRQNTFNNIIELNIAQYSRAEDMAQVSVAGGAMTEITNSPYAEVEPAWSYIPKMMASGAVIHFTPAVAAANKNVPQQDMNAGNYGSVKERVLLWEYASYLMIVDPTRMDGLMFNPFGNFTVDPATVWLPAYETDIGFARSSRTALKSGTDPAGQAYTVWAREFDKALVLIRTKKSWSYTKYGDITAVTVTLPAGTWRMLQPDGSLVGPVTSVRLRASEAAIFMK